jgi:hypothetical protein
MVCTYFEGNDKLTLKVLSPTGFCKHAIKNSRSAWDMPSVAAAAGGVSDMMMLRGVLCKKYKFLELRFLEEKDCRKILLCLEIAWFVSVVDEFCCGAKFVFRWCCREDEVEGGRRHLLCSLRN